jgi:predicted nucleotidyltransferase
LNSVVVKSIDKAAVRRAMDAFAADLLRRREVDEVVVFGSFETDTYAPGSDLDVLIVLRESELAVWDRPGEYRPATFPVPLDLFPFTRAELAARAGAPFARALDASRWRYRRQGVAP